MANNEQANSFLEMMQGNTDTGITDNTDTNITESGLPINPKINNGQEFNLVTSNWEDRPLVGVSVTDTSINTNTSTGVGEINANNSHFAKPIRPMEKTKQRNFGLTDSQHREFLQAAADCGFVRSAKGGVLEPNGSAFLQKIIELKLWEKLNEIEEGTNHE
ncbi:hypothetical protein EFE32_12915 [Lactococcus lactis subsp. lactis]|uniref:hypothetical protein n=1 Tax=Lactococcus lactis TaxID=1358 RepID=UPI00223AC5BF|nr:hypothetical protein [Lactococcus lactis]MCT0017672.1 hypothetical protein [Lactococcus lactis subsp. lactis]